MSRVEFNLRFADGISALWTCVFLMLSGCVLQPAQPVTDEELADSLSRVDIPLIAVNSRRLSTVVWRTREIYVCWESANPRFQQEMNWVRDAISTTWQAASALTFVGWEQCAAESRGLRILIADVPPYTKGLGHELDGLSNGIVLNFLFENWNNTCKEKRETCIRRIATHVFGHSIGLSHAGTSEHTPGECLLPVKGENGAVIDLTPSDPRSVMNYCDLKSAGNGNVSSQDLTAVRFLYGPRLIK